LNTVLNNVKKELRNQGVDKNVNIKIGSINIIKSDKNPDTQKTGVSIKAN
jgi:hypothetical protein